MIFVIFYYSLLFFEFFEYCMPKYSKLLSNTPITKFCPQDLRNIYKIYEKHPDLPEITMCCATRISNNFMLTEKVCLKKFNPKYVTVNTLRIFIVKYIINYIISRLKVAIKKLCFKHKLYLHQSLMKELMECY